MSEKITPGKPDRPGKHVAPPPVDTHGGPHLRVHLKKGADGQWTFDQTVHADPRISVGKRQLVRVYCDEGPFRIQARIRPEHPRPGAPPYPFDNLHDHVKAHKVHVLGPALKAAHRPEDAQQGKGTTWKMTYELLDDEGNVREEWDPHIVVDP